ncbi:hypothetical protein CVT26_009699 [Gymnopilus dilepis]|uniref:Uncharacterized protein n=1 Tax=Gymnopilus dilepis TaxID=231916 RepID=A0A409YBN0_9AGAR|nr:hypothetical protein CVT26_009699 [Gymnopilus dilepis]
MPGIILSEVSFEAEIMAQQAAADNLTSFQSYPFPGQLIEIAYPMEAEKPIPPIMLSAYSRTHQFRLPKCFHGREVRVVSRCSLGTDEMSVSLECDARRARECLCPFYSSVYIASFLTGVLILFFAVNVSALLADDCNVNYRMYRQKSYQGELTPI